MSVYHLWNEEAAEFKMKSSLSSEWPCDSPIPAPKSPNGRSDSESIVNKFKDLLHVESNDSVQRKQSARLDHPFDFFDEEEFLFGSNLFHNSIAHVGEDITKLLQMAQEPWPDNVKLFQPYEVEQILLPDNASCLAVQAYLKMCNLPFEVEMRWNAEFMSPSGRVPFIKCGAFVVSELESIVQFCGNKGANLCQRLTTEEKAEMRAYMSLISNVLLNAELYVSWLEPETYASVTRPRNLSVYPWPLGWLQTRAKRSAVTKRLKALHWYDKTLDQVLSDVEQCCNSLSQRLGDKEYFFGIPTPLDALLYGHVRALLGAAGPRAHLMLRPITSAMLRHAVRVANLTQMKLKPQEDYLVSQALLLAQRRRATSSPDRSSVRAGSSAARRGRAHRARPGDGVEAADSMFGFKPFIAKQVLVMTSKGGAQLSPTKRSLESDDNRDVDANTLIGAIIEEVIDKVGETIADGNTEFAERNDFEIILESGEAIEASLKSDVAHKSYEMLSCEDLAAEKSNESGQKMTDEELYADVEQDCVEPVLLCQKLEIVQDVKCHSNATMMNDKKNYEGCGVIDQSVSEQAFRFTGIPISPNLSATLAGIVIGKEKMISSESPIVTESYASLFDQYAGGTDRIQFLEDTNVHEWIQSHLEEQESRFSLPDDPGNFV